MLRRLQLWVFYLRYPGFRGPFHPHWVGTNHVEMAWRFAEDLGIAEAQGRSRRWIAWDCRCRSWSGECICPERATPTGGGG